MGKASSRKKVERALRAGGGGGGAKGRGGRLVWPLSLAGVVLLGATLIAFSRGGSVSAERPIVGDHWHEAYGVYVCDSYLPAFPENMSTSPGLHTHADGLAHVEPRSTRESGANATLGRFVDNVGLEVTQESLKLPDGTIYNDGDECSGRPAEVRVLRDGVAIDGDPNEVRLRDGAVTAIVFAPADAEIPPVPSISGLPSPAAREDAPGGPAPEPPATSTSQAPG